MAGAARRAGGRRLASREVARAQRESDWLRHSVDELDKLAPQPGEETTLATRRTVMMQSEKVAEDLRDAYDVIAGANSSVPALSGVIRRLERRSAQAPSLVEPSVKSLDAALNSLEETRGHLEAALRAADFDPAELERNEERLFALRAAARKYNVPVDDLAALARKYNNDIALIDAGEEQLKALEAAATRPTPISASPRRRCPRPASRPPLRSTRRSMPSSSRSSSSVPISPPPSTAIPPPPAPTASIASSSGCRPIPAPSRAR